jgi:hypothetical protein
MSFKHLLKIVSLIILLSFRTGFLSHAANGPGIIDSVECKSNSAYSYALYLPYSYNDSINWPVIFIFDPRANGHGAIGNFVQAAEKYDYVLVASNNSHNGISGTLLEDIINSTLSDAMDRYSIDPRRIYTSGFSGGSRVASLVALKSQGIAGVIACGAGFPESAGISPVIAFNYFGLIGDRDMNYSEMRELHKQLLNAGSNAELRVFEGGHKWPSANLIEEAVEWMEMKAMQKGIKQKNILFLDSLFLQKKRIADNYLNSGKIIEAVDQYKSIANEFSEKRESDVFKEMADRLQHTNLYKKSMKDLTQLFNEEEVLHKTIINGIQQMPSVSPLSDSLKFWWAAKIKYLKKTEKSDDIGRQKMASRQLNFLHIVFYESARLFETQQSYKVAGDFYWIVSQVDPANNYVQFLLARTIVLDGDNYNSVRYLEKAVKNGFQNKEMILNDPAFHPLLSSRKFKDLIENIDELKK